MWVTMGSEADENTAEDTLEGKGPFDKISTPSNGAVRQRNVD